MRHRIDEKGECRHTAVELLIDTATVRSRAEHIVGMRIGPSEQSLQTVVRATGATWDHKDRLWRMLRRVARVLHLVDRMIEE